MIARVQSAYDTRVLEHVLSVVVPAKKDIVVKEGVGGVKVFIGDKLVYEEGTDDGGS